MKENIWYIWGMVANPKRVRRKPDKVVETCHSTMQFYAVYEEDPDKVRQAEEMFGRGLRYVAEQSGWLDELEAYNKSLKKCMRLVKKLNHLHARKQ